ncbi:MAG: phosphatase PAP2 family protein [Ginsengibacter sp.]
MKIFLAILLFIIAFFAFVYIAEIVVIHKDYAIDIYLQSFVESHRSPAAKWFFNGITFLGSHFFLLPAYLILIAIFFNKKRKHTALNIALVGISSTALLFLCKDIFKRQRPGNPLIHAANGFSFPSGHSFSSFTFYGIIAYLIWRGKMHQWKKIALTIFLVLLASIISYSRIYLRVHYPSDIIAGFCLSIVWLILSFVVLTRAHFLKNRY